MGFEGRFESSPTACIRGLKMNNSDIINASIRLPRSLKDKANKKAKDLGFESVSGKVNFSKYIRYLIKEDIEGV